MGAVGPQIRRQVLRFAALERQHRIIPVHIEIAQPKGFIDPTRCIFCTQPLLQGGLGKGCQRGDHLTTHRCNQRHQQRLITAAIGAAMGNQTTFIGINLAIVVAIKAVVIRLQ